MAKNSLVLFDLDSAVLNQEGELNEGIASLLADLIDNNILIAVTSCMSASSIDKILNDTGLDIYFPQNTRHSYTDLLECGEIEYPLPDPFFYQYCAQNLMDTLFERVIGITGAPDTLTQIKAAGMMPIAFTSNGLSDCFCNTTVDAAIPSYVGMCECIKHVIYWWDRDDHHTVHIPDPTPQKHPHP